MPHIHTQPGQHDATVCAHIVRIKDNKPFVLLHRHKKLGILLPVGGHVELHETPWQAVLHEVLEESGYDKPQLKVLQPKERVPQLSGIDHHPVPTVMMTHELKPGHYHSDASWTFITHEEPSHKPADGESPDLQLFDAQGLRDIPVGEITENVRETSLYILDTMLKTHEQLPIA